MSEVENARHYLRQGVKKTSKPVIDMSQNLPRMRLQGSFALTKGFLDMIQEEHSATRLFHSPCHEWQGFR